MKHEYTDGELAELKKIYDESGEAGLQIGEMRALRKAGLLARDLPPEHEDTLADYQAISKPTTEPAEPSKRDLILAHCRNRIDQGQPFDGKETAEALNLSQKTAATSSANSARKDYYRPSTSIHPAKQHGKTPQPERRKKP